MRLVPKLLLVSIPLALFWATVSWYYTSYRGDYYFPDRYEDAYGGMLISIAFSALVVIVTVVLHFSGSAKK
jgi:archaellum biogenesis protein FlaJ (TadC family)